ncbi:MAG: hypothetical protein IH892_14995, partial [Planctomycetes bacterium]|nr:hypothetical protein [Planctomycetota bacterium]
MFHSSLFSTRTLLVVGLIVSLATSSWVGAANAVLEKTPAQSLVCVKINNINGTLMKTDQFLQGVSPLGVSFLARMGLGQMLGSPMMTGVDMDGDFALFVAAMTPQTANAGPMPPISMAALMPVTDYGAFIAGNTNCGPADGDGISLLTAQGLPPMFIGSLGKFALIGPAKDRQTFIQLQQEIAAQPDSMFTSLSEELKKASATEPLWLYCNMELINKTLGPLIQMQLQMAKAMVSGMPRQGPDVGIDPGELIDTYGQMLVTFLQQSRYLTLSLHPSAESLRLNTAFAALPDTDLASLLQRSEPPRPNPFLGHLPDGALVNVAFNMDSSLLQKLTDWSCRSASSMVSKFYGEEQVEVLKKMTSEMLQAMGRRGVSTLQLAPGATPPVRAQTLFEVTDPARFLGQLRKFCGSFNDIVDSQGKVKEVGYAMTLDHRANAQTYKGVSIDESKLSLATDALFSEYSPEVQVLRRLYGEGWDYRWAMVDNACLNSVGGDADKTIRQMIDGVRAGKGKVVQSETKAAMALLPDVDKADLFLTVNAIRLFALVAEQAPGRLPKVELPPSKSNLILASRVGEGKASMDLVLPKAHLIEIMGLVQRLLMRQMGAGA